MYFNNNRVGPDWQGLNCPDRLPQGYRSGREREEVTRPFIHSLNEEGEC
jgi:hypothetical protein